MSTLDPLSDFCLPGPAAKETADDRDAINIRPDGWSDDAVDEADFNDRFDIDDDSEYESDDVFVRSDDYGDDGEFVDAEADFTAETPVKQSSRNAQRNTTAADSDSADTRSSRSSLIVALIIVSSLTAGGWYLTQPETLPIKQVNIEGEFRELSQTELQTLISGQLYGGFFSVDVGALREAITSNPWVRDVQVQRVWPNALKISVREQLPIARWNDTGLVNNSGDYFQPETTTKFNELPQLLGPQGMQAQLTDRLQQLQEALEPLDLEVQRLNLSERRAWSFTTTNGLEVVLGRENFDARLERFIELVPDSLGEQLMQAAYIDMRYTNGFAVRFSNADNNEPDKKNLNKSIESLLEQEKSDGDVALTDPWMEKRKFDFRFSSFGNFTNDCQITVHQCAAGISAKNPGLPEGNNEGNGAA